MVESGGHDQHAQELRDLSGGTLAVKKLGNDTIDNYNLITGSVNLGARTNAFNNRAGATFRSGTAVNLGAAYNTLTDAGDLSPGGTGTVLTTVLTGKLVQTGTGTFTVDLDQGGADINHITITGTADSHGKVIPNVINLVTSSGSVMIADASAYNTTAMNTPTVDFSALGHQQPIPLWLNWQPGSILHLLTGPLTAQPGSGRDLPRHAVPSRALRQVPCRRSSMR